MAKNITKPRRVWSDSELALLGEIPDAQLAARIGVTRKHVLETRQRRGIAPASPHNTPRHLRGALKARRARRKKVPE